MPEIEGHANLNVPYTDSLRSKAALIARYVTTARGDGSFHHPLFAFEVSTVAYSIPVDL